MKLKTAIMISIALLGLSCKGGKQEPRSETGELQGELTIFHAGSLAVPFRDISGAFMKKHPGVTVELESGGSRKMIRRITQLRQEADILASSDYAAIEQLMMPDFAAWYIGFATNRMVIAYGKKAKYADEIGPDNWHEVLLRGGVEFGRGDHNMDPCGYRTLLAWKLAEKHYGKEGLYAKLDAKCGEKNVRPKSENLLPLLQSGDMDYAFEYESVARQHGLGFVALPAKIDLSDAGMKDHYAAVSVEVTGKEPGEIQVQKGEPIMYAVTIPKSAPSPELAAAWIMFLVGEEGRGLLKKNFQNPLDEPLASGLEHVPATLKGLVKDF
ncbi:MAG: extracellular solute-binding protein [Pseudomonadota bacterium]